jgi:hypothetical protein
MSRFDLLYQGAVEKRKRMIKLQEHRKTQIDPDVTFFPVTNHRRQATKKTITTMKTTIQPGPPCTVKFVVEALLTALASNSTDAFTNYTTILTKMLAPKEIQVPETVVVTQKAGTADPKRFQSLYDDSVQRKKAREDQQEKDSKRKLFSFAPKINKISSRTVEQGGKDERFASLFKDAELRRKRMTKSKLEQDKKVLHSFQPKINKQPKNASAAASKTSRFDLLYADGHKKRAERALEIRKRRQEVLRLQEEQQRIVPSKTNKVKRINRPRPESSATGAPAPGKKGSAKNAKATANPSKMSKVRQKSIDAQRKKTRKKKQIKSKPPTLPGAYSKNSVAKYRARLEFHRQSLECTFSPKINKRSKEQESEKSVFDRLQQESKAKHARNKQRAAQRPSHCSFTPSINPGPNNRDGTVFARLNQESIAKNKRVKSRVAKLDPECTFSPKINNGINSDQHQQQKPTRPSEPLNSNKKKPPSTQRTLREVDGTSASGNPSFVASKIGALTKRESTNHLISSIPMEHSNERLQHDMVVTTPVGTVVTATSKLGTLTKRESTNHMISSEPMKHSKERLQHDKVFTPVVVAGTEGGK